MNDELKDKLRALGLNDDQIAKLENEGVKDETTLSLLNHDEIKNITDCGLVTAKSIANTFAPAPIVDPMTMNASYDILPKASEDKEFLEALKTGGVLKVGTVEVESAVRAAIASDSGLFNLPKILSTKMEEFAHSQDEPVGESFYELQKMIATRAYADVLSAIGVPGSLMNDQRKRETLTRLHQRLWPAMKGFQNILDGWMNSWMTGVANPANTLAMFMMAQSGGRGGVLPPGLMTPPETNTVKDEAEAFIDKVNSVFAGTGIPVARALAADAARIKTILESPELPATVGAANRDQMLKMLGVNVGTDYVRLERNVVRYCLGVMNLPHVSVGNEELAYLSALHMLGNQIAWDRLGNTDLSSQMPRRKRTDEIEEEEDMALAGSSFPRSR